MDNCNNISILQFLKCKLSCLKSKQKQILKQKRKQAGFVNNNKFTSNLEDIIRSMNSFRCNFIQKVHNASDYTVDTFEDFANNVKEKNIKIVSFLDIDKRFGDFKENLEDGFEVLLANWKGHLIEAKDKMSLVICEVNEKKESVIDAFEKLVERIQDLGLETHNQVEKIECVKDDIIDRFEYLLHKCNDYVQCIEDYAKSYTQEKRAVIVDDFEDVLENAEYHVDIWKWNVEDKKNTIIDEFEDLFENTKWAIEDRKRSLIDDAECAFDDIIGKADEMVEDGKEEIKTQLSYLDQIVSVTECLVRDFLCYGERMFVDFLMFSEKRVTCFLSEGQSKAKVFYNEVMDSLVRGFDEKLLCDNLVLEINSSRYAYNVTMSEVNFHVVRALLTLPAPDGRSWQQLVTRLTYFMPIFTNYIRSEAAQKDCLLGIEDVASTHPEIFDVIVKIIHWLYEQDILSEDAILDWYCNALPDADPHYSRKVRKQVEPFIRWLKEAEETSDSDDD